MKVFTQRSGFILIGLMLAIALTRFNHFGTALALPDASLAVFFLGGLYLARAPFALAAFIALLMESAAVDYYAINVGGVSDWCVSPAYGLLALVYGVMWLAGRLFAHRHQLSNPGLFELLAVAGVASSVAFILSNVEFYLFSGRYSAMSALEYASRVQTYFASYVLVAMFYVAVAFSLQMFYLALTSKNTKNTHAL